MVNHNRVSLRLVVKSSQDSIVQSSNKYNGSNKKLSHNVLCSLDFSTENAIGTGINTPSC